MRRYSLRDDQWARICGLYNGGVDLTVGHATALTYDMLNCRSTKAAPPEPIVTYS